MKIGYICEDFAHAGVIEGATRALCPEVEIVAPKVICEGSVKRRVKPGRNNALKILSIKGANIFVAMSDSDVDAHGLHRRQIEELIPEEYRDFTYVVVPAGNIENWLAWGDKNLLRSLGIQNMPADPTHVKGALRKIGESREERISSLSVLVTTSALKSWMQDKSFKKAFDNLKSFANRTGCKMEKVD